LRAARELVERVLQCFRALLVLLAVGRGRVHLLLQIRPQRRDVRAHLLALLRRGDAGDAAERDE